METTRPPLDLSHLVARTEGVQPWRRFFHAASGIALALGPDALGLERPVLLTILGAVVVLLFTGDLARLRWPRLNAWFFRTFSSLASPREAHALASSSWYALAGLLVWLLFPAAAVPALLVLALADPAASVTGRIWGRRPLGKGTWLGSAVFFVVATGVLLAAVGGLGVLLVAGLVTAVEVFATRVDDNLSIPLATAALLVFLGI